MIIGYYGAYPLNGTSYEQVLALKEMHTFPAVIGELRSGKSSLGTYMMMHPELMYGFWLDRLHQIEHEHRLLECVWD